MSNKVLGSILLAVSGFVATLGVIGAQIAWSIIKTGFMMGKLNGEVPLKPEAAMPHWMVMLSL